jgi:hypothetical protein
MRDAILKPAQLSRSADGADGKITPSFWPAVAAQAEASPSVASTPIVELTMEHRKDALSLRYTAEKSGLW